jgi:hypothetical protein
LAVRGWAEQAVGEPEPEAPVQAGSEQAALGLAASVPAPEQVRASVPG